LDLCSGREGAPYDAQFDFVYCVDAIHHFCDRPSVFSETERLLTAGGIVCIATDSEETIRNREPLSVYWPETVELELARYPSIEVLEADLSNCGFVELQHQEVAAPSWLTDASAYKAKAFSCLRLLPEQTFERGLRHLEADLAKAPVRAISRYHLLWATKLLLTR
jgi:SAM-dependent methyltransferase